MERFVKIILDTGYSGTREEFYAKTNMTDEQLNSCGCITYDTSATSYI